MMPKIGRKHTMLENCAPDFIIHTRVNNGLNTEGMSAVDRFNARAMANDPYRGGANPILSTINGFSRNPNLLDHDPEPELDMYTTTLQLREPVEFDTLSQAFEEEFNDVPAPVAQPQVVPSPAPEIASDDLIDRLAAAFRKN